MADADVRPAVPADAAELARIQVVTWRLAYGEVLPAEVLAGLDTEAVAKEWRDAIQHGPASVFVASEGGWTVGFCATGPAPAEEAASADGTVPEDLAAVALVSALVVEPRWGRRGHGGRLLASAGAAAREGGAARGICWVPEADEVSLAFYRKAGWANDGTVRTLDAGGRTVREVRLTGELDFELT
jgi:GNAT superfamily N-acetyltransferase